MKKNGPENDCLCWRCVEARAQRDSDRRVLMTNCVRALEEAVMHLDELVGRNGVTLTEVIYQECYCDKIAKDLTKALALWPVSVMQ
jgi:hypothetical protein